MTPDEINRTIAEHNGVKPTYDHWYAAIEHGGDTPFWDESVAVVKQWLIEQKAQGRFLGYEAFPFLRYPDYYHDLNEIHEVVCGLTDDQFEDYVPRLKDITGAMLDVYADSIWIEGNLADYRVMHQATAAQRCEAYLRTIGKWRDE